MSLILPVRLPRGGFEWFFPNLMPTEGDVQWENPLEIMMRLVHADGGWKGGRKGAL